MTPPDTQKLNTIDLIVEDIANNRLDAETKKEFKEGTMEELRAQHHFFGMWIRNSYGLWKDNPLTEDWRTRMKAHEDLLEAQKLDGTTKLATEEAVLDNDEYNRGHPDNLSDEIIQALWHYLQKS